ncbi:hypothetical protein Tco_1505569 [Tanacetum coccineum]
MASRQKWSIEDQRDIVILGCLGMGTISEKLMCYEPDTAYGLHPIRRISDESALAVEIDFTWSLGFGSVEPDRPPIPLSYRISVICLRFSSCLCAESSRQLDPGLLLCTAPGGDRSAPNYLQRYFFVDILNRSPEVVELGCMAALSVRSSNYFGFRGCSVMPFSIEYSTFLGWLFFAYAAVLVESGYL